MIPVDASILRELVELLASSPSPGARAHLDVLRRRYGVPS